MSIPYETEKDKSISGGSQGAMTPINGKSGNEVLVTPALGEKGGFEGCKLRLKKMPLYFDQLNNGLQLVVTQEKGRSIDRSSSDTCQ